MRLADAARVLRSKNAGPLQVTLDIMFDDPQHFTAACRSPALTREAVATLYRVPAEAVSIVHFAPALAIKVCLDRPVIAGSPGDRDVFGAQQHRPLLDVTL